MDIQDKLSSMRIEETDYDLHPKALEICRQYGKIINSNGELRWQIINQEEARKIGREFVMTCYDKKSLDIFLSDMSYAGAYLGLWKIGDGLFRDKEALNVILKDECDLHPEWTKAECDKILDHATNLWTYAEKHTYARKLPDEITCVGQSADLHDTMDTEF